MHKKVILFFLITFFSLASFAQIKVDAKIDSLQMWVGEQTDITLTVTMGADKQASLPILQQGDNIIQNIEVIQVHPLDTNFLHEGKQVELVQRYTVTAWDTAIYLIPPFKVQVGEEVDSSNTLALKVIAFDVDTLNLDKFYPIKDVITLPFIWEDWRTIVFSFFALVFMLLIAYFLFDAARKGKPIVRFVRRRRKLPAHEVAIEKIERIKKETKWSEENNKEYYTLLTDALRTYIQERYHFNALEMTSSEIISHLIENEQEDSLDELRRIFFTADLVKFAKYSTLMNENDAHLIAALDYINQTKVEVDPNQKPEPEIIKQTDKQRLNQVVAMRVVSLLLVVSSAVLLGWIIWHVIDLLK